MRQFILTAPPPDPSSPEWEQAIAQARQRLVALDERHQQMMQRLRAGIDELAQRPDAEVAEELCDLEFEETLDCEIFGPLHEILEPEGNVEYLEEEDDGT